jgi:hypothetical protein
MTSPSSRRAGVVQGSDLTATGPEPSSGVGPALHRGEPTAPLRSYLELGALPTAVPCARLHARHMLWEWGLNGLIQDSELLVRELVTNAVKATARRGAEWGRGREPPFVRTNRPGDMGAAGQRGRQPSPRLAVPMGGQDRGHPVRPSWIEPADY